jgi:hypothetical protein
LEKQFMSSNYKHIEEEAAKEYQVEEKEEAE